jgi:OPT family oligopeptide transporter
MKAYKEVPEWWYLICLAISIAIGIIGIACWPTNTTPFVVLYGIALCLVFVVPIGIIAAMTGVEVTLNVLAEFIGGVWVEGNAIAMCFFKSYGYVTCAHALSFSADLKLAHYLKIPPRFTFWAQMVPTLVSTFISVAVLQYQVHIEHICTPKAPFRFTCPGVNTFFTAAVFWGTVGPRKIWGVGGQYVSTLIGFPLGVVLVGIFYMLSLKWPKNAIIRNAHPVVMMGGALAWAPYNLIYIWPAVPVSAFSWLYLKKKHLGFWSKVIMFPLNFVTIYTLDLGMMRVPVWCERERANRCHSFI